MGFLTGALQLVPLVVAAVNAVEKLFHKNPAATPSENNQRRQDAAVDMVGDLLPLIEGAIDKDVVDDDLVQAALRKEIDATVALFNVVRDVKAKRAAALTGSAPSVGGTPT